MADADTENKRRSAIYLIVSSMIVAPVPDGTIATVDRQHITGVYCGIAAQLTIFTVRCYYLGEDPRLELIC